jgi:uncharacterized protein YcgI (DUF1989 family)
MYRAGAILYRGRLRTKLRCTAVDAAREGEFQMALGVSLDVPGYSGRGLAVNLGSRIRITDVRGSQIGDLFALVRDDPHEYLCTARTRALTQRLFPTLGQQFFTNRYRPIPTLISDQSPGIHDTLFASCDPGLHELLGGGADHPNCHENFLAVASELGIDLGFVPGPVNLFQNTPVRSDGGLAAKRAPTKAGDYVDLRAELDLYLILTACSVDTGVDINGGESTPLRIEVFNSP